MGDSRIKAELMNKVRTPCMNEYQIVDLLLKNPLKPYHKHRDGQHVVDVDVEMWVQEVTTVSELTQDFVIGEFICSTYIHAIQLITDL